MTTRQVVVTGGTGALGAAVAARMLGQGADVHVTWKFEAELEGFALADRVTLHEVDCTDEAQVEGFYRGLAGLDASIHVVGGFDMAAIADTSLEAFEAMFRLNAVTTFLCCREAVQRMRGRGGRIVNVAARPAVQPTGGMIAYTTAKGAVASLTQCLADEVRDDGVLVNAVLPSIMDTPANRGAMPDADHGTWPRVEQVAEAIAFLAGPDNGVTGGALLPVFGRA